MDRYYMTPVSRARVDIKLPEPRVPKSVVFILRILGRIYFFLFFGIARIVLREEKDFIEAFRRALAGESRCIIAFRHPNGREAELLTWFLFSRLRPLAARRGVKLGRQPHAVFVWLRGGPLERLDHPVYHASGRSHVHIPYQG